MLNKLTLDTILTFENYKMVIMNIYSLLEPEKSNFEIKIKD